MSDPVERFLAALRERGHEPRKAGDGWCSRCPAHDDRKPSLSINTGNDGRVLLHCHTGCTTDAICSAVGLKLADLFPDDPSRRNGIARNPRQRGDKTPRNPARGGGSVAVATVAKPIVTYPTANQGLAELKGWYGQPSGLWTYLSAAGEPVGLVARFDMADGKKKVHAVWRKRDGSGWTVEGFPKPMPLYRLPELLAASAGLWVWVVEGEKSADAAAGLGLVVTTSVGGSQRAAGSDWSYMRGRDVVVSIDHDKAGEDYGADVSRKCLDAGAKSVRIVRLVQLWADMPESGDIVDYLNHRGGDADAVRAEVEALAEKAEPMEAENNTPAVLEFVPFPIHTLPEPIRGFVTSAALAIGCEPSFIAVPLLGALAAAIGNTQRLHVSNTWHAPPILWAAIIGESGSMKSPAFKLAMKATQAAQAEAFKQNTRDRQESEADLMRYEVALTAWKRDVMRCKADDGYGIAPPEKPALPKARRYIVSDTTVEALVPILFDNPRGVLLARDELAGWLGSFDRYSKGGRGGADSAHYLSMHDGASLTLDRKTGNPPNIHVPSAAVSIVGGIQPRILARAMGQEHHESGMLARLLFAMPPRKRKRWTEADVDPASEAAVVAVFNRLFGLSMEVDPEGSITEPEYRPRLLSMTPDGKAEWVRFYDEHNAEADALTGDDAAAWSKLEGYVPRVALVLHLIRWAAGDATLCDPASVDEASIAAGVALVRWFGNETKRVYAILGESDEGRESRRLVDWIRAKGGTVTLRDLTRGPREYRIDPDKAAKALADLVATGILRRVVDDHDAKGGRPAERFGLVSEGGDTGDGDETP